MYSIYQLSNPQLIQISVNNETQIRSSYKEVLVPHFRESLEGIYVTRLGSAYLKKTSELSRLSY